MTIGIVRVVLFAANACRPSCDQVHLQANQFGRQVREPVGPAVGRRYSIVLPLDVSEFSQPLSERLEVGSIQRHWRCLQYPDAVHLPRGLRLGGKWRDEQHRGRAREERAAVDH
jgi:hypothetical protein